MTFGGADLEIPKIDSGDKNTEFNFGSGEKSSRFTLSYYSRSPI